MVSVDIAMDTYKLTGNKIEIGFCSLNIGIMQNSSHKQGEISVPEVNQNIL